MPNKEFHVILIKPSKYDDDGYVIRWLFSVINSNSLSCLNALTEDVRDKKMLGPDVKVTIHFVDEMVHKVKVRKLAEKVRTKGGKGIACLVGVQTNQFPRAVDIANQFKREGIPAMIGGFHVSGCLAMLPRLTPELREALDAGITLVAGEVETKWAELLRHAYSGTLEPIYNFLSERPLLAGTPGPFLPRQNWIDRIVSPMSSLDAGRGCPFSCSFCTIINIQGHKMRFRTADDIEALVRRNGEQGINHLFITDDNFARHPEWESIMDRLIELKEKEGIRSSIMIQTDMLAHKIPRFVEKTTRAGCRRVFVGLESVNPDNLAACGKRQNVVGEYRSALQEWHRHGALTFAGYIIGFPGDTYESIMRDVEFVKRELPLDGAEFFIMTPLPGSKDHQELCRRGVRLDADMNLYDTEHVVTDPPRMSRGELMRAYQDAWKSFYGKGHLLTLLKRRKGPRRRILGPILFWFCTSIFLEGVHPFLGGFLRFKGRNDRRPGFPKEKFFSYYIRRTKEIACYLIGFVKYFFLIRSLSAEASRPENADYLDDAIRPETAKKVSSF